MTDPKYLTIEGASQRMQELGVMNATVRNLRVWRGQRKLAFFRIGKRLYIDEIELVAYFRNRQFVAVKKVRKEDASH